eukprot:TRINITY_DN5155_c0_g1_i1.p1 TRINITY_DN5155_c0_g1~~TRINITY_DN5155_c0_g1_i1.p1  ORF type:complete len:191 (-),score=63.46 TRINITY_DN5155_c0_g1_i1:112-651(-)
MEEFLVRYNGTRKKLAGRIRECGQLDKEIEKQKQILVDVYSTLEDSVQEETALKEEAKQMKACRENAEAKHKRLCKELSMLKKEKQERLREKMLAQRENETEQYKYNQIFDKHATSEGAAMSLTKKLKGVETERRQYVEQCRRDAELVGQMQFELEHLLGELANVENSLQEALCQQPPL